MPITFYQNGAAALEADVFFTASRPPLEACAGIIRIHARHPVERTRTLAIGLLAARFGKGPPC